MKKTHFPINYLVSCFTPQGVYNGRKSLGWIQMLFVLVFLCALLCVPVSLNFASSGNWLADNLVDGVLDEITADDALTLSKIEFKNGIMQHDSTPIILSHDKILIGQNLSDTEIKKYEKAIVFYEDKWILKDFSGENKLELEMNYPQSFSFNNDSTKCGEILKSAFFSANKTSLILSATLSVGFLIVVSVILLLLGISFFLWLTKLSKKSGIRTWKESLNMSLNSLGLSAIIACFIGICYFDISVMLMIFSLVSAVILILSFAKTKFSVSVK